MYRQNTLATVMAANGWHTMATDGLGPPVNAATHSTMAADKATNGSSGRRTIDVSIERCITGTWPARPVCPRARADRRWNRKRCAARRYLPGNCAPTSTHVLYRRVEREAAQYDVSPAFVLACAIAHEIGRLLLPNELQRGHAPTNFFVSLVSFVLNQRRDERPTDATNVC
jgi:hypothetical protein